MNLLKRFEKMMSLSEADWAKHANPLSVYTRIPCLSFISLSIWSREYMGLYALIPLVISLFWTWYNPRAFSAPVTTDNWASKAVFGERVLLQKDALEIPKHHLTMVNSLMAMIAVGMPILFYGLYMNDLWIIAFGNFAVIVPKLWFLDRMVWIYDDMKETNPEFKRWLTTADK
ncbi:DUF6653 family protein [Vibrio amylolyticus]|uniref:DUF6653 family protein n=1 Tax=Vibrio amylolyticus TaxID=2847292 RepID=UPI0035507933